jgi:RimJ/RimL family protein N-acetyltransferase
VVALSHPAPELTDGVVRLRSWALDDVDCIEQASTDPRIVEATTVPVACTPAAARAFIARQLRRPETGEGLSLAIAGAAGGQALGLVWLGVRPQHGVLGIGYWVIPAARRQGLGARAVRLASDWALGRDGVARVEAWVEPGNLASQRLLISVGFAREGVLRSFLAFASRRADAVVFSRTTES